MITSTAFVRKLWYLFVLIVLATALTTVQAQTVEPVTSNVSNQPKPIPLTHLYLYFLVHQNRLDARAASEEAKGLDGKWMRNHLQTSLGFSDEDFVAIRTSSTRLGAKVTALDAQAKAFRSDRLSSHHEDLKALASQREAYLNAEINYLNLVLSPKNKAALDAFITQLFAPKRIAFPASSSTGHPAPAAVQQ